MPGYERPTGGYDYTFDGLNTNDAPDQIKNSQYPIAENVRALPDRSIATRPGYNFLFSTNSVFPTCMSQGAAVNGVAYASSLTASGGRTPYTFTIISGVLPSGLTLNASTGLISGTPHDTAQSYPFTFRVTDANATHADQSCSISLTGALCPKLTAELPFLMTDGILVRSDTVDTTYANTGVHIDPAQYPGISLTAVWEMTGRFNNTDGAHQCTYKLVDENGTIYGTLTSPLVANEFVTQRTNITLDSVAHFYQFKALARPAGATATVQNITSSVIKVSVTDSEGWRIQIPMVYGLNFSTVAGTSGNAATNNNNSYQFAFDPFNGFFGITTSYFAAGKVGQAPAEFGDGNQFGWGTFLKENAKWPGDVTWELEVWGMVQSRVGSDTLFIGLINSDTNTLVAEVAVTASTTPTRYVASFANNAANFTDGQHFRLRARYDTYNGADTMVLHRASLYAVHSPSGFDGGIAQIYIPAGIDTLGQSAAGKEYFTGGRYLLNTAKFARVNQWSYNVSAFIPISGSSDLLDMGTADVCASTGDPGGWTVAATVSSGALNAFTVLRTPLFVASGDRYSTREDTGFCSNISQLLAETVCDCPGDSIIATDNFNRANGPLVNPPWANTPWASGYGGIPVIASNQLQLCKTDQIVYNTASSVSISQFARLTVKDWTSFPVGGGPAVFMSGTFTLPSTDLVREYLADVRKGFTDPNMFLRLMRRHNGAFDELAAFNYAAIALNDVIEIRAQVQSGNVALQILLNGAAVITYMDTSTNRNNAGGLFGMSFSYEDGIHFQTFDDFVGGEIGPCP